MSLKKKSYRTPDQESNVRQLRLTEERKKQLEKICKNPLFKRFVSETTHKIKLTSLIDFLLEKALTDPTRFFQQDLFDNDQEDMASMIDENMANLRNINELQMQLFTQMMEKLERLPELEKKVDQLAKHMEVTFKQGQQQQQQEEGPAQNIFDNDEQLSEK